MGDLVKLFIRWLPACVCRHNDCWRSCDGERPVFVGTMIVGDLVMVNRPVFVGTMTVGDLVMVNGLCL